MPLTSEFIKTDTQVKVQVDPANNWVDWAGVDINLEVAYFAGSTTHNYEQTHWLYRGQAAICQKANGDIIRVRIGDGTPDNYNAYIQTITDPTVPAQWETWTLLYSSTSFVAIAIFADATATAGYRVVTAGSTAIRVDNVIKITVSGVIKIKPIVGKPKAIYYTVIDQHADLGPVMTTYYCSDIVTPATAVPDRYNYRRCHQGIAGLVYTDSDDNDWVYNLRNAAHSVSSSRDATASDELVGNFLPVSSIGTSVGLVDVIMGPSGHAGLQHITESYVAAFTGDPDYFYVFYTIRHVDIAENSLSNLHSPVFWKRTKVPAERGAGYSSVMAVGPALWGWTESTPVGISIWGLAGVVEKDNYIYLAGNGKVLRREIATSEIDLSDYVISGSLELPRDNQVATGHLLLANQDDVVADLLGISENNSATMAEHRIRILPGQKRLEDSDYFYSELDDWWISGIHRISEDDKRNIQIDVSDFWYRLGNKFRDTYYFPGHLEWNDWNTSPSEGGNSIGNYYTPNGVASSIAETIDELDSHRMQVSAGPAFLGITGQTGHSYGIVAEFQLPVGSCDCSVIFRYKDDKNYYEVKYLKADVGTNQGTVKIYKYVNGVATQLATSTNSVIHANMTNLTMYVQAYWCWITVTFEQTEIISLNLDDDQEDFYGLVGWWGSVGTWAVRNVRVWNVENEISTARLARMLLGLAGYLDTKIDDDLVTALQMDITWGPQTDLEDPASALLKLIEGDLLQIVWLIDTDVNQTPKIFIDYFNGTDVEYVLEDEVISVDHIEESARRPNVIMVDGNENTWTEYYPADLSVRAVPINAYFDLPELLTLGAVRNRALQELDKSVLTMSPGGVAVWRKWMQRMRRITFIDNDGNAYDTRIEGMTFEFNQSEEPFQRVTLDLGPLLICGDEPNRDYVLFDRFHKADVSSSWGDAELGGTWTLTTPANHSISNDWGLITTSVAPQTNRAKLAEIPVQDVHFQVLAKIDKFPDGGYHLIIVETRHTDPVNNYQFTVTILPLGNITLGVRSRVSGVTTYLQSVQITGLNFNPGVRFWIRGESVGLNPTTLRLKIWMDGQVEPATWTIDVQDSSAVLQVSDKFVCLATYLGPNSITPLTTSFDEFGVW
jgi:hypothetical protein